MPNWRVVSEEQLLRALQERLKEHQVAFPGRQPSLQFPVEACSLAVLALRNHTGPEYTQALRLLLAARNRDGSWPALGSDDAEGCWATALAVLARLLVEQMIARKRELFADDERMIGDWEVTRTEDGINVRADARDPYSLPPNPTPGRCT